MRFLAVAMVVVALTSVGCGGGSSKPAGNGEAAKPADRILADSLKAAYAASSVHITGYSHINVGHLLTLDVASAKGKGARGTITGDGHQADIVVIGNAGMYCDTCTIYLRGSAAFWSHWPIGVGTSRARALSGKWIELSFPDSASALDLFPLVGVDTSFRGNIGIFGMDMGGLTKQDTTYRGQGVIALQAVSGPRSVLVAATGTPYPLHAAIKDSVPVSMSYDDWNKPVSITAPPNAVEFSKVSG